MYFKAFFPAARISNAALLYRSDEFSFAVSPRQENFTSVLVNDINLEVDEEGRVISVWGLSPYIGWKKSILTAPHAEFADVFYVPDSPLERSVSTRVSDKRWPVFVDRSSGWVHFSGGCTSSIAAKVLTGLILEIDSCGQLCGIWLCPAELPERL